VADAAAGTGDLTAGERAALDRVLADEPDESNRELWLTRFRAAREAAVRAFTTGPDHEPGPAEVSAATPGPGDTGVITVSVGGRSCPVSHVEISNPDDLPERRYVVAWTGAPDHPHHPEGTAT
jgi:hypothetical protein